MDIKPLIRASAMLAEARSMIDDFKDRQQELFDERTEEWQESDAGQIFRDKIDTLEQHSSTIKEVENELNSSMEDLRRCQ